MHRTNEQHEHDPIVQMYCGFNAEDIDSAVSVILKLRGETCDIGCLYCYEKRKEAPRGARIDASQVQRLAAELFQGRPLTVELHGGEPLAAGRDHVADVLRELATQPRVVRVSMQTNGVLLNEQRLDLFDAPPVARGDRGRSTAPGRRRHPTVGTGHVRQLPGHPYDGLDLAPAERRVG
ncbi:radical SAM protein [Streptomyces decoyicus]|uniref:radical SAM protein n=1 Tax=Streptomyces decoyicus TaxID=249567 RepID=UPI0033E65B4B